MNTDSDPENILKKYKLRQPSSDLKARVASATHAEWGRGNEGRAVFVDFSAPMWRLALSLAASLLVAVVGNSVNNMIMVPFESENHNIAVTQDPQAATDTDIDFNIPRGMSMRLVGRACQTADAADFLTIRKALNRELESGKGACEDYDGIFLPGRLLYNLITIKNGRVKV